MQQCNRCNSAGFPGQMISFEKLGEDPATGKAKWKLVNENGEEHVHKSLTFVKKRIVDVAAVHVTRGAEDLPRDPRDAPARQLPDRQHVEARVEGRLRRHPDPPVLEVRVRVGPADHDRQRRQRRAIVEAMTTRTQPFPPDTMFLYSNVGFIIAGAMLEAVTGTGWEALLTDRVFEPLGMASCGFGAPGTPGT